MKSIAAVPFFFGLLISSCGTVRFSSDEGKLSYHLLTDCLPGVSKVDENFFCDDMEATNFNWAEYRYWNKKIFGENSPEHKKTEPDTRVWAKIGSGMSLFDEYYWTHPAYTNYPVVGISQQQAEDFSKWRSDRVFEYLLIRAGVIEWDSTQNSSRYFTIEKYFNGAYDSIQPDPLMQYYPDYRLPTAEEFERSKIYGDSLNISNLEQGHKKYHKEWLENYPNNQMALALRNKDSVLTDFPTIRVDAGCYNHKWINIYHLIGNVSEWTSITDQTWGGSWHHTKSEVEQNHLFTDSIPTAYIGFRNVCSWKKWE